MFIILVYILISGSSQGRIQEFSKGDSFTLKNLKVDNKNPLLGTCHQIKEHEKFN